jgi:hypothetical protein
VNPNIDAPVGYLDEGLIKLNPGFVEGVREMFDAAHSHGIKVGMVLAWSNRYVRNSEILTEDNAYEFGEEVREQLGDHPAIEWWIMGGDNGAEPDPPVIWRRVAAGLEGGLESGLTGNGPYADDFIIGFHNTFGQMRFNTEWWNEVGLAQTGHCGPVNMDYLSTFIESHDGLAGNGEPCYLAIDPPWCDPPHTTTADDVVRAMQASLDAGGDFHVYGDVRRYTWGTEHVNYEYEDERRGFDAVRATFGSEGERRVMELVYR